MDPNETLRQMRTLVSGNTAIPLDRQAELLAEHVNTLDEWLSRGGFLPDAWESACDGTWHRKL